MQISIMNVKLAVLALAAFIQATVAGPIELYDVTSPYSNSTAIYGNMTTPHGNVSTTIPEFASQSNYTGPLMGVHAVVTPGLGQWISDFFRSPKLDQYTNLGCVDDSKGRVPIIHVAPRFNKCYNIDPDTESFFWQLGRRTSMTMYSEPNCKGYVVHYGKGDGEFRSAGCQAADPGWSRKSYGRIGSVKMS